MNRLPRELLYQVGSYAPAENQVTRKRVLDIDPYDPQVITDMLNLGIDPLTVIGKERQRQREEQRLRNLPAFALAQLLYSKGSWTIYDAGPNSIFVDGGNVPTKDEANKIGYDIDPSSSATIIGHSGEDLFGGLVAIDRFFYPVKVIKDDYYESNGPY